MLSAQFSQGGGSEASCAVAAAIASSRSCFSARSSYDMDTPSGVSAAVINLALHRLGRGEELAALTALVLAGTLTDFAIGHRRMRWLKDVPPAGTGPTLSIVAAARNEAVSRLEPRDAARAALECRVHTILSMGNGNMVFGDVLSIHIDDAIFSNGRVDMAGLHAVGRLCGHLLARDHLQTRRKDGGDPVAAN